MGRVEKRMYIRQRNRRRLQRLMLLLAGILVLAGLALRQSPATLQTQHVPAPTPTAIPRSFDETVQTREITLEQQTWYAIQTGIYSTQAGAEEKVDTYAQRGAPGYVNSDGEKWRVYIACYATREDAAAVRERLSSAQKVETYLHSWICPEITLRLTGMAGQVDVAQAGLTLMMNIAAALRDNAALLDAGEISLTDARGVIAALDGQADMWLQAVEDRFVQPRPELIEQLAEDAARWRSGVQVLDTAADATVLSARMKLQAMALYDGCCALRESLMD